MENEMVNEGNKRKYKNIVDTICLAINGFLAIVFTVLGLSQDDPVVLSLASVMFVITVVFAFACHFHDFKEKDRKD